MPNTEDKTLAELESSEELLYIYKPISKYISLWNELKHNLTLDIYFKSLLSVESESKIYRRALFRLHNNDRAFKQYCIGKYGIELTPASFTYSDKVTLYLYDPRVMTIEKLRQLSSIDKLN